MRGAGHRAPHELRSLAVGALLLAPLFLTNCVASHVDCSKTSPTDTIVGRLLARHGAAATFSIESVTQPSSRAQSTPIPPLLAPGQSVDVHYSGDHAKFLRVGASYRVEVLWVGYFRSDVHVASDPCSSGTVYANGRPISTSSWTRSHLAAIVAVFAAVPLLLLVILATFIRLRRRARLARSQ